MPLILGDSFGENLLRVDRGVSKNLSEPLLIPGDGSLDRLRTPERTVELAQLGSTWRRTFRGDGDN